MLARALHHRFRGPVRGATACALLFLFAACSAQTPQNTATTEEKAPPPEVAVAEVQLEEWPETLQVQGNLLGHEHATIGSKLAGRVDQVHVDLGSAVKLGDPLVTLETHELQLRVQQAEAQLQQACAAIGLKPEDSEHKLVRENSPVVVLERAMLDEARANAARGEQLVARGTVTAAEYEGLQAAFRAAEARYRSALNRVGEAIALVGVRRAELALSKQQLDDAQIVAPFPGVVEQRIVASGEYVQVGQSVVAIVRTDLLRFTAGVPERLASRIRKGQQVRVVVEGEKHPLPASVSRVSPSVNASNRALSIEVDVPNPDLRLHAGRFAEVEIETDADARALVVPTTALREFAGIEKVWIVRDNEAEEVPVRTGRRSEHIVEVLSGLTEGDLVVQKSADGQTGPVVAIRTDSESNQRLSETASFQETGLSE